MRCEKVGSVWSDCWPERTWDPLDVVRSRWAGDDVGRIAWTWSVFGGWRDRRRKALLGVAWRLVRVQRIGGSPWLCEVAFVRVA